MQDDEGLAVRRHRNVRTDHGEIRGFRLQRIRAHISRLHRNDPQLYAFPAVGKYAADRLHQPVIVRPLCDRNAQNRRLEQRIVERRRRAGNRETYGRSNI